MDIRTLPDQERTIYNELKKAYSLHFDTTNIKEHSVRLLKPSDLDELLEGKGPLDDVGSFPFWFRIWEADVVLAHILVSEPNRQEKHLLDLGAGLGLTGIAAAKSGFKVTLSDNQEMILDFQRVSCAANGVSSVNSVKIDFLDLPEIGSFDVIAGAEVLFKEEFVEPMLTICQNCLNPGGIIYLAHDVRRRSLPMFLEQAQQDFLIGSKKQTITKAGRKTEILVNRLQRRQ